jgi:transcriptional regulator with XRE-family HTH domain
MDTLAERLKTARKNAGMTQSELAAASGISQAAIGKLECGLASNSRHSIAIAQALNVSPNWLVAGDENQLAQIRIETNKHKAHQWVKQAIRDGYLPKPSTLTCQDCGASAQVYDHRDYNRPLDVDPVCHACNINRGPAVPFVHVNDR